MTKVDELLREAKEIAAPARLATWLPQAAQRLALPAASSVDGSVVLGSLEGGPAIGIRRFRPGEPTTVHGHRGWGVLFLLEGEDQYERWESTSDGKARLAETRYMQAGDAHWFAGPPHDIHRQLGTGSGALELVLLENAGAPRAEYQPDGEAQDDAATRAILAYDWDTLTRLYHPAAVLDMNVPRWRFQLQGADAVLDYARGEGHPRLAASRVTRAATATTVEVEMQAGDRMWREVHIIHLSDGTIMSHTVYCTGIWEPDDIRRQAVEAPMVRP